MSFESPNVFGHAPKTLSAPRVTWIYEGPESPGHAPFQVLGLFGSRFGLFWDHFGFPGPDSIFGNLVFLGFHVGSSGAPFWKPGDVQMEDFKDPGLLFLHFG